MDKAIVLAAGKGTRMKSKIAKVLHPVNGKAMIRYMVDALESLGIKEQIIVVGHQREQVTEYLGADYKYAVQEEQLGTGHAVLMAREVTDPKEEGMILVACGDTPLLTRDTLGELINAHRQANAAVTLLTCDFEDPTGYGRILRDDQQQVIAIVEEKDATEQQKLIREINTGTYCFAGQKLWGSLDQLKPANAQGEYYLTDVIELLVKGGENIASHKIDRPEETMGINNRVQLAEADKILRKRKLHQLMESGVTIVDPDTTYIEDLVSIGEDTTIYPNTFIFGHTKIGHDSTVGPNTKIVDSTVGNQVTVEQSTVLESQIGDGCSIGPYAYIRPQTVLAEKVKIGDFVEIKKTVIGAESKVPHLSYIGDSTIGSKVNIGAGTITCNYDGIDKHQTIIHDEAFVGSNTNLVAPVEVGAKSLIGAGSTITKDVPAKALAIARSEQTIIKNYVEKRGILEKKQNQ